MRASGLYRDSNMNYSGFFFLMNFLDEKLRLYLGDDGLVGYFLKRRGKNLLKMRDKRIWKSLNEIDLRLRANYDNAPTAKYGQEHSIWDSWALIVM